MEGWHETEIRVRYAETDRMGLLHHANYLVYFEQSRTELLRTMGFSYKDLEDQGYLLVLTKVEVRYKKPAFYDELLTVRTIVEVRGRALAMEAGRTIVLDRPEMIALADAAGITVVAVNGQGGAT